MSTSQLLSRLLTQSATSIDLVEQALKDENLAPWLTPDVYTLLIERHGRAVYSENAPYRMWQEAMQVCMQQGGTPWQKSELVDYWVARGEASLVEQALKLAKAQGIAPILKSPLSVAAERNCATMLQVLWDNGYEEGSKSALNTALHGAKTREMVSLLIKRGASVDAPTLRGAYALDISSPFYKAFGENAPMPSRLDGFFVSALEGYASLDGPGLRKLAVFFAGHRWFSKAMAVANLSTQGYAPVSIPDVQGSLGPLSGWAWGMLRYPKDGTGRAQSPYFLKQCLLHADDTWDVEWAYAAGAVETLHRQGNGSIARLAGPINERIAYLSSQPSLSTPGLSRWEQALVEVVKISSSQELNRLAFEALTKPFLFAQAAATSTTVEQFNAVFDALPQSFVQPVVKKAWGSYAPLRFLESLPAHPVVWLSKVDPALLYHPVRQYIVQRNALPGCIALDHRWPEDIASEIKAHALAAALPSAPSTHRRPRM